MEVIVEPTTSGWDRRRERIAREIERVALELFARSSPGEVTIEQIAAAAGISNRTFFRYFASRDDILVALPQRSLQQLSAQVRARPASETMLEAFTAAGQAPTDPVDLELVLLWSKVVNRSPDAAMRALAHSAVGIGQTFSVLVAERLGLEVDDPRCGALGAAIAGVVSFAYRQWVDDKGRTQLGDRMAEAFGALNEFHAEQPVPARRGSR